MADTQDQQLEHAASLSVQKQRDSNFFGGSLQLTPGYEDYAYSLPSVYDSRRQYVLNRIDSHPQNNLWQGAVTRIAQKVAGTSAEITGKRRVKWYQDVIFFNSDYGAGIGAFLEKLIADYFRYDDGAVVEIIGRGSPDSELTKDAIVGIAILDPLRCFFTQNRDYPVWYQDSVTNKIHKLHWTRVHRFVSRPFSDPELRGRGLCALSRAVGFVQQTIINQTYVGEMLSHEFPPGILLVNGVQVVRWQDIWRKYKEAHRQQGLTAYQRIIEYVNPSPNAAEKVVIEFIPFSTAPTNYDPIELTKLHAQGIALGLDTDPNDVLPVEGGNFGQNGQSKVLDQKNRDGGFTHLLRMLERFFNKRILPDALKFTWKYRDSEQSLQAAEIASKHMTIATGLLGMINASNGAISPQKMAEVALRYLADNVDAIGQILYDPNGELISMYDDDPADEVNEGQQIADDLTEQTESPAASAADPIPGADNRTAQDDVTLPANKDFDEVRKRFVKDFTAVLFDASNGDIASRRRAGTLLRSILTKEGRRSEIEGLKVGGVDVDVLEGEDLDLFLKWNAEQSGLISNLTARVWDKGLTEAQINSTVEAWANKSLTQAYNIGLMQADRNGLYIFYGEDGTESCPDCKRLKGKKFRLKDWIASDYLPSSSNCKLECGGFQCQHRIRKTTGRASSKGLIGLKALLTRVQKWWAA